jgi:hypothetical protein
MKTRELTPRETRCVVGACPAIFETADGQLLLIGKTQHSAARFGIQATRVGPDETLVAVPKEMVMRALLQLQGEKP